MSETPDPIPHSGVAREACTEEPVTVVHSTLSSRECPRDLVEGTEQPDPSLTAEIQKHREFPALRNISETITSKSEATLLGSQLIKVVKLFSPCQRIAQLITE